MITKHGLAPEANGVAFSDPDFTSNNVHDAIVEAKQNAEGFPRAGIRSTANGVVGNNDWIGPNELLPNTPMLVAPVTLKINEITWSNRKIDVEFHIEFRLNSKTGTIFHTLTVTSPNSGSGYESGINYTLTPGDTVWAQYKDDGQNMSDADIILWVSRVP